MKKISLAGTVSGVLAVLAIGFAAPAFAVDGTVALPPGGPVAIYPGAQDTGGANPFTPFGTSPYVPWGAWSH
jgi:hypothetical protein